MRVLARVVRRPQADACCGLGEGERPLPKGYGLIHLDNDRSNNALENLHLLTISEISKRSLKLKQFASPNGSMKSKGDNEIPEWQ